MMREIHRNNYEAFLLDLAEGRLSAKEQQMLRDFLLLNPDCGGPAEGLESWVLSEEEIAFPDRDRLKKNIPAAGEEISNENFELLSIARLEGDLSPEQEKSHESLLGADDAKRQAWLAWKKTKLVPPRVEFPGKRALKKHQPISRRVLWVSVISAAAAIALLITLTKISPVFPGQTPLLESELREYVPEGGGVTDDPGMEAFAPVIPENEMLASEPVTLSIKKNPDPPELTGKDSGEKNAAGPFEKESILQTGPGDSVNLAGRERELQERIRIAVLDYPAPGIMDEGVYDRITPLALPAGSVHMTGLSIQQLSSIDLQQMFEDFTEENEISLWTIANSGIRGINRLTGADLSLLAQKDEDGDIAGIRFRSRLLSFSTRLQRED